MAQVSVAQTIQPQNQTGTTQSSKTQGILKTSAGEIVIDYIPESESISKDAGELLQLIDEFPEASDLAFLKTVLNYPPETIEVELEILDIMQILETVDVPEGLKTPYGKIAPHKSAERSEQRMPLSKEATTSSAQAAEPKVVYSSLFSLARSLNQTLHAAKKNEAKERSPEKNESPIRSQSMNVSIFEKQNQLETRFEKQENRDKNEDQKKDQRNGKGSHDEGKKKKQNPQKEEYKKKIQGISAARSVHELNANISIPTQGNKGTGAVHGIENIYIRFMALMARILGQAEAEAHDLYLRIKERTDSVDALTLLISKINSEKGPIDWTKNEELKKLVDRARQLGVDIPQGKYTWNDEEKKLLKENVQMRKDSMEKVTQLERTDMQRYLQEASQCHQARSNVLKLLKEVMDTIIANMRP